MDQDHRRYADLPKTVRAFLETLDEQEVVNLSNMARFYRELTPDAREFLLRAKPKTLEWLREAREEEIDQLDEGIHLVQASRTVGRFMKWVIITVIAAFMGAVAFGKFVLDLLQGGRH